MKTSFEDIMWTEQMGIGEGMFMIPRMIGFI